MLQRISGEELKRLNKPLEFSDRSSEISNAMRLVRIAAEPRPVGDSVRAAIGRACRHLGWRYNRTREIWYGTARRIESHEMDRLRSLEREADAKSAATERARYLEQIAVLRTRLQMRDPEFHRADCIALDWLINEIGGGRS
jgi:hypothetical protein